MKTLKIEKKHIPKIVIAVTGVIIAVICIIMAVRYISRDVLSESSVIGIDFDNVLIIADGGNNKKIPKNTVYAIDDLATKQFKAMKIDARLTKDKKYVSLEDADISQFTEGKGDVSSYNYFDLLEYNIKDFRSSEYPVTELVSKTAKYAYSNNISPIIFLHDFNKKAIKGLIREIAEEDFSVYAYASDNIKELQYIRKLDNQVELIYQVDEITDEIIEECKDEYNISICFNYKAKDSSAFIGKMESEKIGYLCYGTKTLKDVEELYKFGVRRFITDTVKAG